MRNTTLKLAVHRPLSWFGLAATQGRRMKMGLEKPDFGVDAFIGRVVASLARVVAHAATDGGDRRSLAQVEGLFWYHLVHELERRGITRPVCADMLGTSPRTIQRKLKAHREAMDAAAAHDLRSSLLSLLTSGRKTRAVIQGEFHWIERETLSALLRDLVDAGWLQTAGESFELNESADDIENPREFLIDLYNMVGGDSARDIAARMGIASELVDEVWGRGTQRFFAPAHGQRKWSALTFAVRQVERFVLSRIADEDHTVGGAWRLRIDDKSETEIGSLRTLVKSTKQQIFDITERIASSAEWEGDDVPQWSLVLLEAVDNPADRATSTERQPEK